MSRSWRSWKPSGTWRWNAWWSCFFLWKQYLQRPMRCWEALPVPIILRRQRHRRSPLSPQPLLTLLHILVLTLLYRLATRAWKPRPRSASSHHHQQQHHHPPRRPHTPPPPPRPRPRPLPLGSTTAQQQLARVKRTMNQLRRRRRQFLPMLQPPPLPPTKNFPIQAVHPTHDHVVSPPATPGCIAMSPTTTWQRRHRGNVYECCGRRAAVRATSRYEDGVGRFCGSRPPSSLPSKRRSRKRNSRRVTRGA